MSNCILASASAATVGTNGYYQFPYNPVNYDSKDDFGISQVSILHGAPATQALAYDGRPRIMKWEGMSTAVAVETMLTTFRSRIGKNYWIKFNELGQMNHNWPYWIDYTKWYRCRIVDVKTSVRRGGKLYYDTIELWLQPR